MFKRALAIFIIAIISFTAGVIFTRHSTIPMILTTKPLWPQNAMVYLTKTNKNKRLIPLSQQNKAANFSLQQYFEPWDTLSSKQISNVLSHEKKRLQHHKNQQEYGVNFHTIPADFYNVLATNMNLSTYPNCNKTAIVIHNTNVRDLPTNLPAFANPHKNITYPFDLLQRSALWVGQPIHILQKSTDGAWFLVHYNNRTGWLSKNAIAFVSQQFISKYRQHQFASFIRDNAPVRDNQNNFLFYSRIGMLLPIQKGILLTPTWSPTHNQTILRAAQVAPADYTNYPMPATAYNFATLMNAMLGEPYTWNALHYRECSLTIKDLLMTFGIWLPKHSQDQLIYLPYKNLQLLTTQQRIALIQKTARPFLTLLGTPGHVTLYIGQYHHHLMVFEDRWGFHTKDIFSEQGRMIIGKTIINSLQPHKKNPLVISYLLGELNKMTDISGYPDTVIKPEQSLESSTPKK